MLARSGSYLIPSLLVHGAFFAALASVPATVEGSSVIRAIEFISITDVGGGRLGNDEQVGDAVEPTDPPQRLFRKVQPKPVRKEPVVEQQTQERDITPEPIASDSGEGGEAHAAASAQGASHATSHSMVMGSAGTNPNATSSGVGHGDEGVDRRSALRAWLRQIQREVNKIATRNYPSSAVRMHLEGRLRLGITIGEDGKIVAVRVLSSSGHPVLDDSATASVMALLIPPPPEALGWREREISLPIRYAID
ncbi:MAG: hypothetical protein AMJ62_02180 [Myxococcales bacterium SG8_38]|nr:MAG: hypothetical protein AMJ62_02180 [Myxococcales bacterium SG8_38]